MGDILTTTNVTPADIVFESGSLQWVDGLDFIRQRLEIRLDIQKGEWFMDLRDGIPWREAVLVRNPNLSAITALFTERILSTPSVVFDGKEYPSVIRLDRFDLAFDNVTGFLTLDFLAITPFGTIAGAGQAEDLASLLLALLLTPVGSIA